MMAEMEEICRSIKNAPDLSDQEKEKLVTDFTNKNLASVSEWITGTQSVFDSFRERLVKVKRR
jgi:hypothetical protein